MVELRELLEQAVPERDVEVPFGEITRRARRRTTARRATAVTLLAVALLAGVLATLQDTTRAPVVGEPAPNVPATGRSEGPTQGSASPSTTVGGTGMTWRVYLDQLTHVLRTVHPHGDDVDWDAVRDRFDVAALDSDSDGYRAAAGLAAAIGDRQTRFTDALTQRRRGPEAPPIPPTRPSGRLLDGAIGHLVLPGTSGPGDATDSYVRTVWETLRDTPEACGWVVDLRGNPGGDAWVMVQGVGPLLGDGLVLRAAGPSGTWDLSVEDGQLFFDGLAVKEWAEQPFEPISGAEELVVGLVGSSDHDRYLIPDVDLPATVDGDVPVALLYDAGTASSAEIVAMAMRGRPGPLRSFGSSTAGVPLGVTGYELVDGSVLAVTTHILGDRTGTSYEDALEPDVATGSPLEDAQAWLGAQASCQR